MQIIFIIWYHLKGSLTVKIFPFIITYQLIHSHVRLHMESNLTIANIDTCIRNEGIMLGVENLTISLRSKSKNTPKGTTLSRMLLADFPHFYRSTEIIKLYETLAFP